MRRPDASGFAFCSANAAKGIRAHHNRGAHVGTLHRRDLGSLQPDSRCPVDATTLSTAGAHGADSIHKDRRSADARAAGVAAQWMEWQKDAKEANRLREWRSVRI